MNKRIEKWLRFNKWKLRWSLAWFPAIEEMIKVFQDATERKVNPYPANNWKKWFKRSTVLDCMQRHVSCLFGGIEYDSESKLHHIWHIMCNCTIYFFHHVNDSFLPEDDES